MSNVPPPFSGSEGYRKKSNTGLIIMVIVAVLVGGCILLVGAAAFFGMNALNTIKPMIGCAVSFEAVRNAMRDYAAEHGGKLPAAATWQDELRPYMEKAMIASKKEMEGAEGMMRVMDVKGDKWGCYTGSGDDMTGMAFNTNVGGKKIDEVESRATTVLVFEVAKGEKNLHMPFERQDEKKSPTIFGDHRGWFEVTWEEAEMLSDGQRVNMSSSRRNRNRDNDNDSSSGSGAGNSNEGSTSGAGDSSGSR